MTNNPAGYNSLGPFVKSGANVGDWHRTAFNSNVGDKLPLLDGVETFDQRREDSSAKEGFKLTNNWGKLREELKPKVESTTLFNYKYRPMDNKTPYSMKFGKTDWSKAKKAKE